MTRKARKMPRDLHSGPVAERVAALNTRYRHHSATAVLEHALKDADLGKVALVSSFGAESVVLLHLVSVIAPETPVLFVDTKMLFQETLDYQRELAEKLALCDIRTIRANPARVNFEDPDGTLHQFRWSALYPALTAGSPAASGSRTPTGAPSTSSRTRATSGSRSTPWRIGGARTLRNTWWKTVSPGIRWWRKASPPSAARHAPAR
jgi:hypothetical protein